MSTSPSANKLPDSITFSTMDISEDEVRARIGCIVWNHEEILETRIQFSI